MLVASLIYPLLLLPLGFILATALLCFAGALAFHARLLPAVISAVATAVVFFVLLGLLSARVVWDEFSYGETSMALGVPRWWYGVLTPLLAAAVAVRALFHRPMVRPEEEALLHPEGESR